MPTDKRDAFDDVFDEEEKDRDADIFSDPRFSWAAHHAAQKKKSSPARGGTEPGKPKKRDEERELLEEAFSLSEPSRLAERVREIEAVLSLDLEDS